MGYTAKTAVVFSGKETEIELILSQNLGVAGVEEAHCEAYRALLDCWDKIVPNVLEAILEYQKEAWGNTDYTQSFPQFKSISDVLENVKLTGITVEAAPPKYRNQEGRYVVFIFNSEWVNDDYGLLSVALINEKVVEVSDQAL